MDKQDKTRSSASQAEKTWSLPSSIVKAEILAKALERSAAENNDPHLKAIVKRLRLDTATALEKFALENNDVRWLAIAMRLRSETATD